LFLTFRPSLIETGKKKKKEGETEKKESLLSSVRRNGRRGDLARFTDDNKEKGKKFFLPSL